MFADTLSARNTSLALLSLLTAASLTGCCTDNGFCISTTYEDDGGVGGSSDEVGDGGENGEPYSVTDPCEFENWSDDIYSFKCINDSGNVVQNQVDEDHYPPHVNACVPVSPSENPSTWEAAARAKCNDVCKKLDWDKTGYVCSGDNWSSVEPVGVTGSCAFDDCSKATTDLNFSLIADQIGYGPAVDAQDLPCDLPFDCSDFLTPEAQAALWSDSFGNPVRYTADVQVSTSNGYGYAGIFFLGEGQSLSAESMEGEAAYTAVECEEDACPFYLAHYSLVGDSLDISFGTSTTYTKALDDFSLELQRPALGIWLPNSGQIIFPTDSLKIRVAGTISGTSVGFGENGFHEVEYSSNSYVFGSLIGSSMNLNVGGNIPSVGSYAFVSALDP